MLRFPAEVALTVPMVNGVLDPAARVPVKVPERLAVLIPVTVAVTVKLEAGFAPALVMVTVTGSVALPQIPVNGESMEDSTRSVGCTKVTHTVSEAVHP